MILTPVAQVLLTILIFARERDRTYVLATVLAVFNLVPSLVLSPRFGVG